jgi:hypothetical protein
MEGAMKSPTLLLESLLDDFKRLNPDVEGLKRDLQTLKQRYEDEGYGFLTVALPALDSSFVKGLSSGQFACPAGFKTIRGGTIPRLLSGMFCKVFEPITGTLKQDADIGVIKCIRNILLLFKKVRLSPENEEFLHKKAVREFYECDKAAGIASLQDRQLDLIHRVTRPLLNTLNSKDLENAVFRHGPGAVEEGYSANQKWSALSDELRSGLSDISRYGLEVQSRYEDLCDRGFSPRPQTSPPRKLPKSGRSRGETGLRIANDRYIPIFGRASRRRARLISVLKNSTSRRTITVEPMLNQFVQQGLNTVLRGAILECRILSRSIALSDQSKNQELALEGSRTNKWATLDLKSASDLLSVKLVEAVFGNHGHFFDHMMDCRSTDVYTDCEADITLSKFAGMGNALTFPVQTICFAVVSYAAILDCWGVTPTYWNLRRASRHVRVYGDDIIVSTEYAHQVAIWLESVGLKVNRNKSFFGGYFKESCGVDAFRGVDVTPLYLRYRPDERSTDPSIIAGLVSLSNSLWLDGLYKTGELLREEVEERLGKPLPLVSSQSGLLGWHSRIDASNAHKWCKRTQQLIVRAPRLQALRRVDRLDGYAALLKYFSQSVKDVERETTLASRLRLVIPSTGIDPDHLESTPIRYKNRICRRWVPVRVLRAG